MNVSITQKSRLMAFLACFCLVQANAQTQITVTPNQTAQALANKLAGTGLTVSNATLNCPGGASGLFDNPDDNSNLGINEGILLTTGSASAVNDQPKQVQASTKYFAPGDASLDAIIGTSTKDACVLEFDVVPAANMNNVSFRYQFGSEEYTGFTCSQYNDPFALIISGGSQYATPKNIALVPNTNIPVSINTINGGTPSVCGTCFISNCTMIGGPNSDYFIDNTAMGNSAPVYDGLTTILTASAAVTPGTTYHLKLAIADGTDGYLDSGIFLEAGSLNGITTDCSASLVLIAVDELELHEGNVVHGSAGVIDPKGVAEISRFTTINDPGSSVTAPKYKMDKAAVIANKIVGTIPAPTVNFLYNTHLNDPGLSNGTISTSNTYSGNYKDLEIKDNLNVILSGTVYGKIKVKKNDTITFTQPDVYIKELEVDDHSRFIFTGNTNMRIAKKVKFDKYTNINPTGMKVTWWVQDPAKMDKGEFHTEGGATMIGNVVIPTGKFEPHGDYKAPSTFTGVYYAEEIDGDAKGTTWYRGDCSSAFSPFGKKARPVVQEEAATANDVAIYPNPTAGQFTLRFGNQQSAADVVVTDLQGKTIERRHIEAGDLSSSSTFDMSGKTPGIYMIDVRQDNNSQHMRLVVQ